MPLSLRKYTRRYAGVLVSIGILLGVGAGTWWWLIPHIGRTVALYNSTLAMRRSVASLSQKETVLASLDPESLQSDAAEVLSAVPGDKAPATLMGTIEALAAKSGLSVTSLTIESIGSIATEAAARQSRDEIELGAHILLAHTLLEGNEASLEAFLTSVHRVRRLLRVMLLDVSYRQGAVRAQVGMEAYYLPLKGSLGDISGPMPARSEEQDKLFASLRSYPVEYQAAILPSGAPSLSARENPFSP